MQRELETHFDVKVDFGFLVQGKNQKERDTAWWSSRQKQLVENYYWARYKAYIEESFNDEVIRVIDKDTDIIMDNLEDPNYESFNRYGMVVGHVQSGKTANYSALVCKACDAGYNFIVVVAGGMNNLRNQTQERLNESFVGQDRGRQVGAGVGNSQKNRLPISLTTQEKDFNKADADRISQSINFENTNAPILLVIKKNTRSLANVIDWLERQYKNQIQNHSMLLIDDESDYASINTNEENDPTTINTRLRTLISLFRKSVYVAYTATPYANIFIDHEVSHDDLGKDLFPKDFIYALDAPTNYFGARRVFLDTNLKHLVPIDDYFSDFPIKHKKDWDVPSLPNSLQEALTVFFINIGIRALRGQADKHNSMLIHATRFTMVHEKIGLLVSNYVNKIQEDLNIYGKLSTAISQSSNIEGLKNIFDKDFRTIEFSWEEVLQGVCKMVPTILVREVHQRTSQPLIYREDMATNAIVIGGTSLSRGYTLEGLSVSYFLRNTVFYDTLMQMGRWFGYRVGYEDLCKVYLPESRIRSFSVIIEATEDLIDDFKKMSDEGMTPNDFGLAVKHHPDSGLQVTARNKQKNAQNIYFDMKLDGHSKETAWLHNDPLIKQKNLKALESFIGNLAPVTPEKIGNAYLWQNISKEQIIVFLDDFDVFGSEDELSIRTRMPIKYVQKYAKEIDCEWDVALYSGSADRYVVPSAPQIEIKKEERKVASSNDKHLVISGRQVSAGGAESIVLDSDVRKKVGSKRKEARAKMKKPLLMLHILQTEEDECLAAFGVSFPGGINSGNRTIRLKINRVFLNDLLREEIYDD